MKFKIGDRVKFLNSVGGGEITSFLDKNKVMVETEDGFDVPVLIKELVHDDSETKDQKQGADSTHIEEKSEPQISYEKESDMVPDNIEDDQISFALRPGKSGSKILSYIINSSSYYIYYVISERKEVDNILLSHGQLEPDTKERLQNIVPLNIHDEISFDISVIFYGTSFYVPIKPVHRVIRFTPSNIYSGDMVIENDFFETKAAVLPVYEFHNNQKENFENKLISGNLEEIIAQKEKKENKKSSPKAKRDPEIEEVDLHIHAITDNYKNLSNSEIVNMQLSRFKTSLDTAILHKTPRIVFIHGIGAGKLKHELRRKLDREYPDLKYQDASFKEYGYGATMVIIPQKK